jgi:hypothetical protein
MCVVREEPVGTYKCDFFVVLEEHLGVVTAGSGFEGSP